MTGIIDKVNECRAKQGKNKFRGGASGKGDAPRQSEVPDWAHMKMVGETEHLYKFEIRSGHYKFVSKNIVDKWNKKKKLL